MLFDILPFSQKFRSIIKLANSFKTIKAVFILSMPLFNKIIKQN